MMWHQIIKVYTNSVLIRLQNGDQLELTYPEYADMMQLPKRDELE